MEYVFVLAPDQPVTNLINSNNIQSIFNYFQVTKPTDYLKLHASAIDIQKASVTLKDGTGFVTKLSVPV